MRIVVDMKLYCGTKMVAAAPMVMQEFYSQAGRDIPEELDLKLTRDHPGYLVEYEPEEGEEHGYQSWSPATAFERSYYRFKSMPFGVALERCKSGAGITRRAWVLGQSIAFVGQRGFDGPYLCSIHHSGRRSPWSPDQADLLANDWYVIKPPGQTEDGPESESPSVMEDIGKAD